jgi:hypothetical protein
MHTMKLRALQLPSQLESLLDSLVMNQHWVPAEVPRVTDRSALSAASQKLAIKAVEADGAWMAWRSHDGIRLFIAEMSMELSRERGRPALKVKYYNDQGRLQQYSLWVQLTDGAWQRCAL